MTIAIVKYKKLKKNKKKLGMPHCSSL